MYKVQAVVLAVMAALGAIDCAVFPAGKCNTRHIEPAPIDLHKIAGYGKLDMVYGPEIDGVEKIDRAELVFTRKDDNTYNVVSTKYYKDKSVDKSEYSHSIVDGVIIEDGIDAGKPFHFHAYPLATSGDAILLYRCADSGRQTVDTRFIIVPSGKKITEANVKELMDADKKFSFRGSLYKFPNQLAETQKN